MGLFSRKKEETTSAPPKEAQVVDAPVEKKEVPQKKSAPVKKSSAVNDTAFHGVLLNTMFKGFR